MEAAGVRGPHDPGPEALELLTLDALPRVGPATLLRLVRTFGSARAALRAPASAFGAIAGAAAARARRDDTLSREVGRALERAVDAGIRVVTWTAPDYPPGLHLLADPPPVVFLKGEPGLLERRCVTVVGSRRATGRAREVAERLGAAIARTGGVVVSGLALGVDGASHRGALAVDGGTVAVLGTGPDVAYPRTHRRLFEAIAERGLLVSEFLPGTPAAPHHFPRRNRILAALSGPTVVVEAGARSGALITVDHALDLGREVWAVPGPIDGAACRGSNRLLSDGARPLVSIADFVAEVLPPDERNENAVSGASPGRTDDGLESRILRALAAEPLGADDVAGRVAVPVETVLAALTTLELFGEVERLPGLRFRLAA